MMRVTNGMMMTNTKNNINKNKATVDEKNTQMSTQKKITKPSDDPLIAIKSLRLSTTLSQIHQFYDNNISDAESWMDVTETAMTNMKSIVTDAYKLTVNGATDTLTEEDRNTIYTQLNSLSKQLYAEANADYAGRTVFSGFKTNETVSFTNASEAAKANYQIDERFSYEDIERKDYYANHISTPGTEAVAFSKANNGEFVVKDEAGNKVAVDDPQVQSLNRIRLGYDKLEDFGGVDVSFNVTTSSATADQTTYGEATIKTLSYNKTTDEVEQEFQWKTHVKDGTFVYTADDKGEMKDVTLTDVDGYSITFDKNGDVIFDKTKLTHVQRTNSDLYKDADGNIVFTVKRDATGVQRVVTDGLGNKMILKPMTGGITSVVDTQGNVIDATTSNIDKDGKSIMTLGLKDRAVAAKDKDGNDITYPAGALGIHTADKGLDVNISMMTMTEKDFAEHLTKLSKDGEYTAKELAKFEEAIIYLPDSGEIIVGSKLSDILTSEKANFNLTYDKNGFKEGEVRPEMYYNCIKKTDASQANWINYKNYDNDGNWIAQSIDYAVSGNQYLNVNTQINDVINSDCYRDMQEMINTVKDCIDAHKVVDEIKGMMAQSQYSDNASQAFLKDALEAAEKQAAYFDDNIHNVFSKQITRFEGYLEKVNLALTDIGSRGDQLSLASNRMANQQTTFRELKSKNEDAELSDIAIDYTSAYTAYQASLQAAGKIDKMSLLDYI